MTTETVEKDSGGEVDVESFVEADEQVSLNSSSGFARLKSCTIVDNPPSGLPSDYAEEFSEFTYDRYFVFEAEMVSEGSAQVSVVLPARSGHKEIEVAYDWTDSRSISDLAGCVVPLRHVNGDSYRVEKFDGFLSGMCSVDTVSSLVDRDVFEYSRGVWGFSGSIVWSSSIFASVVFALVCLYGMTLGFSSFIFGVVFFLFCAFVLSYASMKKR